MKILIYILLIVNSYALNNRRLRSDAKTLLDQLISIGQADDLDAWVERADEWRSEADNYIENAHKHEEKLLDVSAENWRQQSENNADEVLRNEQMDLDSLASASRAEMDIHLADIDPEEETLLMEDIKKDEENLMNLEKKVHNAFKK